MTDREFKQLSRPQLIEIIYQLQLREEEILEENEKLKKELENRRIRVQQAGNLAEAVLEINQVAQSVQNAAQQYLEEVLMMRRDTKEECQRILEDARKEAAAIVDKAVQYHHVDDRTLDEILAEFGFDD